LFVVSILLLGGKGSSRIFGLIKMNDFIIVEFILLAAIIVMVLEVRRLSKLDD
jgi:hypothetical protein